jgi:uncharacterized protein (TIGR03086 family)
MTASPQETNERLQSVLSDLSRVVGRLSEHQLHDQTPCPDYDVEQLRNHILGWLDNFSAGFADPDGQAPAASIDDYSTPENPASEVFRTARTLDEAVRKGAGERPLRLGESEMPGGMSLSMMLWEYQVHGWDLARATGQDWSPPADGLEASLEFAPTMLTEDYQGEGKAFGPRVEVPNAAPPLDRLLGLSGRDPGWTASSQVYLDS